jgi:uncharacterized NAD(P)/FAD-binding protein YdhS
LDKLFILEPSIMTKITIVGGGVSGVLLAVQLIRAKPNFPLSIMLIEKEKNPWLGVAYSTNKIFHLLNVRAAKMSALPEEENHFVQWLSDHHYNISPKDFAPRFVFREYIEDLFNNTLASKPENIDFKFIHGEAVGIEQINKQEASIHLQDEKTITTNFVVLALGNFNNNPPPFINFSVLKSNIYFNDPWRSDLFENLKKDTTVCIFGTGPTMVDVVLTLYHKKNKGKIIAISRHGLLPSVHTISHVYPDFSEEVKNISSLTEAVKIVRKHIAIAETNGTGWRAVVDAMRPFTQKLWIDLPIEGKTAFLKYYKTYWEIARSRMPEECAAPVKEMISSKQLNVQAGKIESLSIHDSGIVVKYQAAKNRESKIITVDAVVNCMGPGLDFEKIEHPFIKSLMNQGMICNSDVAVGIKAMADGTIIKKDGTPSGMLYTLGSLLRGVLWETIAIPEIRTQAKELAALLLEKSKELK